jgi:hypothetical protein
MESVEPFAGGLGPSDSPDLAHLFELPGQFVSCYVDTDAASEDALQRLEIHRKDVRRELESLEAAAAVIEAIDQALHGVRELGEAAAVIAEGNAIRVLEGGDMPLGRDIVRVGPLPSLGPLLGWRQHRVPYLAVACDRAGADIGISTHSGTDMASAGDPDPHDPALHKVPSGGWSQRRYQERVQNAWERNARAVVDQLEHLVERVHPRLILFGGDLQAVSLLKEHAGQTVGPLLQEASISRAADGSERHDARTIRRAVETAVAADTAKLMATMREMRPKSLGVEGASAVLAALTASQVDTLLVHDDPDDDRTAFCSLDPLVAGLDRGEVASFSGKVLEARLPDVAIAAAFRTGAKVRMVPGHPLTDGIAALLRFPT